MRSALEKSRAEQGMPGDGGAGPLLSRAVRAGLVEKATIESRLEAGL